MKTEAILEVRESKQHSPLPWRVEIGNRANTGQFFIEGTDEGSHYKQHIAQMHSAFQRNGDDCRKANAEFIVKAANSLNGLLKASEETVNKLGNIIGSIAYHDEKENVLLTREQFRFIEEVFCSARSAVDSAS